MNRYVKTLLIAVGVGFILGVCRMLLLAYCDIHIPYAAALCIEVAIVIGVICLTEKKKKKTMLMSRQEYYYVTIDIERLILIVILTVISMALVALLHIH